MSKAVRIREHLYAEIEALAARERRSIIGQLEILLEQALRLSEAGGARPDPGSVTEKDNRRNTDARRADLGARSLDVPASESRKIRKRLWACPHFVPPSKLCEICDVEA